MRIQLTGRMHQRLRGSERDGLMNKIDEPKYTKEEIAQAITNVAVDSVSGMSVATNEMRQIVVDLNLYKEVEAKCDEIMTLTMGSAPDEI